MSIKIQLERGIKIAGDELPTEMNSFEEIVQKFDALFNDQSLKLRVDQHTWEEWSTWFEKNKDHFLQRTISPEAFYNQMNSLHQFFLSEVKITMDQLFPFPSINQLSHYEYTPDNVLSTKPVITPFQTHLGEHFCGNCGAVRIPGTRFCPHCGYRFPTFPRRPLGIKIIMGLLVVGGIFNILGGLNGLSDSYLSSMYWVAFWTFLIGVLQIGAVYGLRCSKSWAGWAVVMIYVLNILLTLLLAVFVPEFLINPVWQIVFSIIMAVIIINYLHSRRMIFPENDIHSDKDSLRE